MVCMTCTDQQNNPLTSGHALVRPLSSAVAGSMDSKSGATDSATGAGRPHSGVVA